MLTKNPLANVVKKHVGLIFSPAGEISNCFQTFRQSYLFRFATNMISYAKNAISHVILHLLHAISHATNATNVTIIVPPPTAAVVAPPLCHEDKETIGVPR